MLIGTTMDALNLQGDVACNTEKQNSFKRKEECIGQRSETGWLGSHQIHA